MKRQILISSLILLFIQNFVSASTFYVPSRDYPTIQSAINTAVNGDVVVVAPGVYAGAGNINLSFGGKAITVKSTINPANPNPAIIAATIIDCGGQPAGSGVANRAFWFHNSEGPNSKVLGFTIRNGYARGPKGADGTPGYVGKPVSLFRPYILTAGGDPNDSPPYALNGAGSAGDGYGGAILCQGASPTIKYCVIKNCTVTGAHGGKGADGLSGTWSHYTLSDVDPCTGQIDVNAVPTPDPGGQWGGNGGAGSGNGYGGAIACRGGSNPIISDCIISDNFARGGRGGDGGAGGNGAFTGTPPPYTGNGSFGGNAGYSNGDGIGGAIYAENGSSPIITNCTFSNDIATTGPRAAGGIAGQGTAIPAPIGPAADGADGLVFSTGGIAGGAAYYKNPSANAHFTNCTFTGNKAYEAYVFYLPYFGEDISAYTIGGAIDSNANNIVNLNTCTFTDNLGGAVYCGSGSTVDINNCSFTSNSDPSDGSDLWVDIGIDFGSGGAIYLGPSSSADIQNCVFGGNSAKNDGGALKCKSNATLTNCSFSGNRADSDNDGYGYGGAMDAYEPGTTLVVDFNNCGFTGNQAIYGGGFSSENFDANFIDCYFIGNTAHDGGGLDLVNGDFSVSGGVVKANNATDGDGGGFDCWYTAAEIRNCTISDNSADGVYPASGSGGAINFYGWASTQKVFNCLITGNSADVDGGAIFCSDATPQIGNCTFSGNLAGGYGGAIYSDFLSEPNITDCIFEGCNNHAIHEEDFGGNAIVRYSLFYNNPDKDYYESGTSTSYNFGSVADPNGNFNKEPLFVSGDLGGYYLSQSPPQAPPNSPAINNGSNTAANLGLNTFTTRTDNVGDGGQVDRGYHYRKSTEVGTFQLTASVVGGHGSVAPTSGPYYAGTIVTLTATPNSGWRVKAWTGTDNDSSTATTNTVIMNSNRAVTVKFDQPKTLIVAVGGGQQGYYSTIQDAVSDAGDGDTIVVYPGIYYGGYFGVSVYVDKSITIRSVYPDNPSCVAATIIDGYMGSQFNEGYNNHGVTFGSHTDADTIFNGFTIRNCGGFWGNAIDSDRDAGHPNGYDGGGLEGPAIYVYSGGGPTIKNCVLRDNWILGGNGSSGEGATGPPESLNAGRGGWGGWARGGAVYCGVNSSPTFINCRIIDNEARGGNGGDGGNDVVPGGWPNYGGNWSMRGTPEYHVYDIDPYSSNITDVIDGDLWEIWGYIGDYRWYSGYGGGVFIDEGSIVTFIHCTISGNLTQGGVSGQGGVFTTSGRPIEPLIPYEIPSFGGGVYCAADSNVAFTDCTITENISSEPNVPPNNRIDPYLGHGGGVCAEDTATVIFTDCTFSRNDADVGGGLHFTDANAVISDCNFTFNSAFQGGGLFGEYGPATIRHSNFTNNIASSEANDPNVVILGDGGGLHLWATDANIIDCNISSNQAEASGGGVFFGGESTPSLTNCLLTNNTAGRDGGGVSANIFSQLTISNCTIADNVVTGIGFEQGYGGGLYCSYDSYTNIINTIIWDNSGNIGAQGSQLAIATGFEYDPSPSTVNITYSDIQDATDPNAFGAKIEALDLVFCIDTTGSMADDINAVKTAANQITGAIVTKIPVSYRLAVVDYKDFNQTPYGDGADYPYRAVLGFTTDTNLVVTAINSLTASGGGDGPESVYTALMHCIDHNSLAARLSGGLYGASPASLGPGAWRPGNVMRVIILMGDAQPHDPEPFTNYTLEGIVAAAGGAEPKRIVSLLIGGDANTAGYFGSLAGETGGTVLQAAGAEQVVEALMDAIDLISQIPDPIFVDANCIFNWDPNTCTWDPNSHNIDKDPCFVAGYYLSQGRAGQDVNSPCVDSGSADANNPNIGLDTYTTATNSVPDVDIVDMGYHYGLFTVPQYRLDINATGPTIISPASNPSDWDWYTTVHLRVNTPPSGYLVLWTGTDDDDINDVNNTVLMDRDRTVTVTFLKNVCELTTEVIGLGGTIMPAGGSYPRGTVVDLIASPDAGYRVKRWIGTDHDASVAKTNTVTMYDDVTVYVEFELPSVIHFPGPYSSIQEALDNARDGDAVLIAQGVYHTSQGYQINNKAVTIASMNPDDPCVVATTIIEMESPGVGGWVWHAFTFSNVGPDTILDGLTIRGFQFEALDGDDGAAPDFSGRNGNSFSGGAIFCNVASPTIRNCIITDCSIIGGDGGNGAAGTAEHPEGGHGGWPGQASGAGLACLVNSNPTVINCIFTNCVVVGGNGGDGGNGNADPSGEGGRGGGWYYGYDVNWPYGPYEPYTRYSGLGGAVYIGKDCSPEFRSCTFENNRTEGGTCGICGQDNGDQGRDEPGILWEIENFGGAVFCETNSSSIFTDCNFTGNTADTNYPSDNDDPYVSYGGAVAWETNVNITFEDCTFSENLAAIGGAMYWSDANVEIVDCNISGNLAYQGGGLFGTSGSAIIENCIIQSNFAGVAPSDVDVGGQGGGIYSASMAVEIFDCNISDNEANTSGGGIFFVGVADSSIVTNCLITNNLAGRDGGGLSVNWYAAPLITNCTIVGNEAVGDFGEPGKTGLGGGIYSSYHSYSVILNSILWNNYALKGNELAVGTGFEYDPRPSTVNVSYSDVKGGQAYVFKDLGCALIWGAGNIQVDPCFVTGPLGSYYLSQTDTNDPNQTTDSPCVDTGNDLASNVGLSDPYTTRTDEVFDTNVVDMGYHYPLAHPRELCSFCDLSHDGDVDLVDFAIFSLYWLNEDCSNDNDWCGGADFTFDSHVNFEDLALLHECWLAEDTDAPLPNPSEWKITPHSTTTTPPYTVSMTAETAFDSWGGIVEYYFECVTGNDSNSGWDPNTTYISTNLDLNTTYGYRVKACDERGHETQWSAVGYAVTGQPLPDHNSPQPDPMTWATVPTATGSTSITMKATTATDSTPPVEYYFECTNHGDANSNWRTNPTYVATGLTPSTQYTFRVRARDGAIPHNETGWSVPASATTSAVTPPNYPPAPVLWAVTPYETGSGSNAYAHMTAQVATDPEGSAVQYYFQCIDFPGIFSGTCGAEAVGYSSGWINVPQWDVCIGPTGQGLDFRFKVRDLSPDLKESGWSTTWPCFP